MLLDQNIQHLSAWGKDMRTIPNDCCFSYNESDRDLTVPIWLGTACNSLRITSDGNMQYEQSHYQVRETEVESRPWCG